MWLQLGGHADGEPDLAKVASMEAHEESGLQTLIFLNFWDSAFKVTHTRAIPFDLDVHLIPESKGVPEHLHYDVRYLVMGDHREAPVVSEESHDVAWFPLDDARKLTNETSMQRQFSKIAALKHALRGT
jgi:8-oxo-dGTP pyrophosphatase MutT (NUDIX family)